MRECSECKWNYLDYMVNPFITSARLYPPVCGICALELTNKLHGTDFTNFTGKGAEKSRQDALKWRKSHPECESK